MGQAPVCSFCSENEGDKNDIKFPQDEPKIIISKVQSLPKSNNIILKQQKLTEILKLLIIR